MLPMLRNKALPLLLLILFSNQTLADAYADARAELMAAYQAQDFPAMQVAAIKALDARPGYPGALFNLAYAKALDEDYSGSLQVLQGLVDSGVDYRAADVEDLAPLQSEPAWKAYAESVEALNAPAGDATIAFRHVSGNFVPEGIVADGNDLLLGSIRNGYIERLGDAPETLSQPATGGHWSVFGMRKGPDNGLWYVSAAVPEFENVNEVSHGLTGLFRLDLESGETTVQKVLPKQDVAMVLGDLIFADDDTIYITESLTGALYRYTLSADELVEVVAAGKLRSMQGLALDAVGEHLYVADYVGGLFRIALSDFSVQRVTAGADTTLFGIDGLYRHGNELIAIQNGVRPNRVVAFSLADDGQSITKTRVLARKLPEMDEPTLGTVVGDEFLFIANSHWNHFDRDGNLPDGLSGPIILRVKL